ncbi:MAG: histidine phosphatase family protein [Roseburia sp.]|nr:histidine phosphatase family protein [Roseburia sp.]
MKIYFVRHGETDWTRQQRLQGRQDIPLNERGIRQLEETGKRIAQMGLSIDVILSSPLLRARKSAELIAGALGYPIEEIVTEPLFIERDFGRGEGTVIEDLGHRFPEDTHEDMESIEETCKRADKAIRRVVSAYSGKTVLVVAHGAILKALLEAVSHGKILYRDQSVRIAPGSIFCLEYRDGSFCLDNLEEIRS